LEITTSLGALYTPRQIKYGFCRTRPTETIKACYPRVTSVLNLNGANSLELNVGAVSSNGKLLILSGYLFHKYLFYLIKIN